MACTEDDASRGCNGPVISVYLALTAFIEGACSS